MNTDTLDKIGRQKIRKSVDEIMEFLSKIHLTIEIPQFKKIRIEKYLQFTSRKQIIDTHILLQNKKDSSWKISYTRGTE